MAPAAGQVHFPARGVEHANALPFADPADPGQGQVEPPGQIGQLADPPGPDGEQQLVVVAAGEERRQQARVIIQRRAGGVGQRHAGGLDLGPEARGLANVTEIGDEPIGDIDDPMGEADKALAKRQSRAGQPVAVDGVIPVRRRQTSGASLERHQAKRPVPDTAGDEYRVPGLRRRTHQRTALGHLAKRR